VDANMSIAAEIVTAYVANNALPSADLPKLICEIHAVLGRLSRTPAPAVEAKLQPAIPVKRSVTPDFIVCLEDGRRFKSLKRHLNRLGMTPAEYRAKWNLPADYPIVAPNYSTHRSQLTKKIRQEAKRKRESSAKRRATTPAES